MAVVGPLILTLVSAAMALRVNKNRVRGILWATAFALIGAISIYATIVNQNQARVEMLGGDQFCFVTALYDPGMDPKSRLPLVVTNPGDLPLYDVSILIFRASDSPANGRTISLGTLHPQQFMRRLDLEVPLDSYVIDIRTRAMPNGFFESLTLTANENGIHQRYYVRRTGSDEKLMDAN